MAYSGSSLAAPHPTIANLYPMVTDQFHSNLILFAYCTGSPDTTANVYEHGCLMVQIDTGTGNKAIYENVGSSAVPSWNLIGSITPGEITLPEGQELVGNSSGVAVASRRYGAVAVPTSTGGTLVPLFGATANGFNGTLTSIFAISSDATAGSISIVNNGTVIGSIVKSNVAGSMKGCSVAAVAFTSAGSINISAVGSDSAVIVATFTTGTL